MWFKETENSESNGQETQQTQTSSYHTTTQDQLQSMAARSGLEMGYTKEQVLDSLKKNLN